MKYRKLIASILASAMMIPSIAMNVFAAETEETGDSEVVTEEPAVDSEDADGAEENEAVEEVEVTDAAVNDVEDIVINTPVNGTNNCTVYSPDDVVYYEIPEFRLDREIMLFSLDSIDARVSIYDESFNEISADDDSGFNMNFFLRQEVYKNKKLYFGVSDSGASEEGSSIIFVYDEAPIDLVHLPFIYMLHEPTTCVGYYIDTYDDVYDKISDTAHENVPGEYTIVGLNEVNGYIYVNMTTIPETMTVHYYHLNDDIEFGTKEIPCVIDVVGGGYNYYYEGEKAFDYDLIYDYDDTCGLFGYSEFVNTVDGCDFTIYVANGYVDFELQYVYDGEVYHSAQCSVINTNGIYNALLDNVPSGFGFANGFEIDYANKIVKAKLTKICPVEVNVSVFHTGVRDTITFDGYIDDEDNITNYDAILDTIFASEFASDCYLYRDDIIPYPVIVNGVPHYYVNLILGNEEYFRSYPVQILDFYGNVIAETEMEFSFESFFNLQGDCSYDFSEYIPYGYAIYNVTPDYYGGVFTVYVEPVVNITPVMVECYDVDGNYLDTIYAKYTEKFEDGEFVKSVDYSNVMEEFGDVYDGIFYPENLAILTYNSDENYYTQMVYLLNEGDVLPTTLYYEVYVDGSNLFTKVVDVDVVFDLSKDFQTLMEENCPFGCEIIGYSESYGQYSITSAMVNMVVGNEFDTSLTINYIDWTTDEVVKTETVDMTVTCFADTNYYNYSFNEPDDYPDIYLSDVACINGEFVLTVYVGKENAHVDVTVELRNIKDNVTFDELTVEVGYSYTFDNGTVYYEISDYLSEHQLYAVSISKVEGDHFVAYVSEEFNTERFAVINYVDWITGDLICSKSENFSMYSNTIFGDMQCHYNFDELDGYVFIDYIPDETGYTVYVAEIGSSQTLKVNFVSDKTLSYVHYTKEMNITIQNAYADLTSIIYANTDVFCRFIYYRDGQLYCVLNTRIEIGECNYICYVYDIATNELVDTIYETVESYDGYPYTYDVLFNLPSHIVGPIRYNDVKEAFEQDVYVEHYSSFHTVKVYFHDNDGELLSVEDVKVFGLPNSYEESIYEDSLFKSVCSAAPENFNVYDIVYAGIVDGTIYVGAYGDYDVEECIDNIKVGYIVNGKLSYVEGQANINDNNDIALFVFKNIPENCMMATNSDNVIYSVFDHLQYVENNTWILNVDKLAYNSLVNNIPGEYNSFAIIVDENGQVLGGYDAIYYEDMPCLMNLNFMVNVLYGYEIVSIETVNSPVPGSGYYESISNGYVINVKKPQEEAIYVTFYSEDGKVGDCSIPVSIFYATENVAENIKDYIPEGYVADFVNVLAPSSYIDLPVVVAPEEPTPTPTPEIPDEPTPTPAVKETGVAGFAERLYTCALNRDSDPKGKQDWIDALETGTFNGAQAAHAFFFSPEFIDSNVSDEEFINRLYATFMDREPDPDGFETWIDALTNKGWTREQVFMGFVDSQEWANVCFKYDIVSGGAAIPDITLEPTEAVIAFATRLYTTCLGREGEPEGIKNWSEFLANRKMTGTEAALNFFFSAEFVAQNVTNGEYVDRLYATFMGRPADSDGREMWVGLLESGEWNRLMVLDGFAQSDEFKNICKEAGIKP